MLKVALGLWLTVVMLVSERQEAKKLLQGRITPFEYGRRLMLSLLWALLVVFVILAFAGA